MTLVHRVLAPEPVESLEQYLDGGGGKALDAARRSEPGAVIAELEASGLRGRGGAGFPTGRKWRTVATYGAGALAPAVVVNGAEGEPGTFKDRAILDNNPYQVVEGALVAAHAVGAAHIVFAVKPAAEQGRAPRLPAAVDEVVQAGLAGGVALEVFEGPAAYLYGEETALLEVIEGRPPFPRVAPPYRRGVVDVYRSPAAADAGTGLPASVEMASPGGETPTPPALVDNVETLANVPGIIANGAAWFQAVGTPESPGTIVCTITGATAHAGVGEVAMGTPLREAIEAIGGGPRRNRRIVGAVAGVSNAILTAEQLDTPLSYEAMAAVGSGLGTAGFTVFDDGDDLVANVAGISRFLAVESCGQCTPCKNDGLAIAALLARLSRSDAGEADLDELRSRVATVADESRCFLAAQHQLVVASLLERFPGAVADHLQGRAPAAEPALVAEIVDIRNGTAIVDERHRDKQPDWTYGDAFSGKTPVSRLGRSG